MSLGSQQLADLRRVINENLRVERAGADPVPYIDVSSALNDISARQNHAVFARRGCGKTLLLPPRRQNALVGAEPLHIYDGWSDVAPSSNRNHGQDDVASR